MSEETKNNWEEIRDFCGDILTYPCVIRNVSSNGVSLIFLANPDRIKTIIGKVTHWMPLVDPVPVKKECWLDEFVNTHHYPESAKQTAKLLAYEVIGRLRNLGMPDNTYAILTLKELIGESDD